MKGWFAYKSKLGPTVTAMQVEGVYEVFLKLFNQVSFDQVIEIGTAQAGTTLITRDALNESGNESCPITTYDPNIGQKNLEKYISEGQNIKKYKENIFNSPMNQLKENASIYEYLNKPDKTLLICDGGCKFREFNVLAPLLKSGDYIMAHDYAEDVSFFNEHIKDKIWNWHEINYSQIKSTFESNNFEHFMKEDFERKVWLCARKK